ALRCGNSPLLSRSLNQHESRRCSGLAHRILERPDGVRSIGILVTITLVADGLLDLDALPIRVQFICDNDASRQKCAPAHIFNAAHDISPAADLIAARIRL